MTTLQDKIDAQHNGPGCNYYPQFATFEGIHPIVEVSELRLSDLCDYTERLARKCRAMRASLSDDSNQAFREDLDHHHMHLYDVTEVLAKRCRQET